MNGTLDTIVATNSLYKNLFRCRKQVLKWLGVIYIPMRKSSFICIQYPNIANFYIILEHKYLSLRVPSLWKSQKEGLFTTTTFPQAAKVLRGTTLDRHVYIQPPLPQSTYFTFIDAKSSTSYSSPLNTYIELGLCRGMMLYFPGCMLDESSVLEK